MPHKLSLAFLTLFDCGPVETIRIAAETGFDMVGLRLLPAAPGEDDYPLLTIPRSGARFARRSPTPASQSATSRSSG